MEPTELLIGVEIVPVGGTVDAGGVFGVPGVPDNSIGEPGDASGSTKSSKPSGVGNLLNSSLNKL